MKLKIIEAQVPHSQCSLREKPKFLQNFRPKNNTLKGNICLLFSFNCVYQLKENFQNLRQKRQKNKIIG